MSRTGRSAGWMRKALPFVAAGILQAHVLHAQQIAGSWQGTVDVTPKMRLVVQLEQASDGAVTGKVYSLDQSPHPFVITKGHSLTGC